MAWSGDCYCGQDVDKEAVTLERDVNTETGDGYPREDVGGRDSWEVVIECEERDTLPRLRSPAAPATHPIHHHPSSSIIIIYHHPHRDPLQ
eukprot:3560825-Rhodomonas_salina.6